MKTISLQVPDDLFEAIKYCADQDNVSVSYLGRTLFLVYTKGRTIDVAAARLLIDLENRGRTRSEEQELLTKLRFSLPYGIWICADGNQVLFNRKYCAIFERDTETSPAKKIFQNRKIQFVEETWFWNDGNPPWRNQATLIECLGILAAWGVELRSDESEYDKTETF